MACNNTTTFVVNNAFTGTYQAVTHAACVCNEMRALYNRHLIDRCLPEYDKYYYRGCFNSVLSEFHFSTLEPCSYYQIINRYHGSKKNAYMFAHQLITDYGYLRQWAAINMFVKPDKYPLQDAYDKAPRAIQYRRPAFNLMLARYLHPVEEWFYQQKSPTGFRFVAKGLNNVDRAILLKEVSESFQNPVYVLLDHSAFDSSITVDHIKSCHKFYNKLIKSRTMNKLLRSQLNNKGYSRHGIKYTIKGTRMSGDFDTALGNTLVNYAVLRSWLKLAGIRGEIILDGDDSIVVVERASLAKLDFNHFSRVGFSTKHSVVHDITEVEFCQGKYLPTNPPRFARNPLRALSRYNISVRNYHGPGWHRYLAGVGRGEMAVSSGVPILEAIGSKLANLSDKPLYDTESWYRSTTVGTVASITDEVRDAFCTAWGITPSQQINMESEYTPIIRAGPQLIQAYYSLSDNASQSTW